MLPLFGKIRELRTSALNALINLIKLNSVSLCSIDGREMVIKRRNLFGRGVTRLANGFFRVVRAPIGFCPDVGSWQDAEVQTFNDLHDDYYAKALGTDAVCADRLPGESLWHHLQRGTLTPRMLVAAARELRRAHGFWSEEFGGPWSHGDAAMRNVLYDPATHRARLIDFELRHDPRLSSGQRQAEDLLSFLLDLASLAPRHRWLPWAATFLRAYDEAAVTEVLRNRLFVPTGFARLWWLVRTNFASRGKIAGRLEQLRGAIDQGSLRIPAAGRPKARRFHHANPSSHCQEITPGTPNASSRMRRMSASAMQSAGEIPSHPPTIT